MTWKEMAGALEYLDPRTTRLFVAQIVFLVLVWVFVFLRVVVRTLIVKQVSLHDSLMFTSVACISPYLLIPSLGV
jgi:hypothetical protein